MKEIKINLTTEERNLAESYARSHSISFGEAFKKALHEQIEDEYNIAVANEAYEEYVKSGKKADLFPSFGRSLIYRKIRQKSYKTTIYNIIVQHYA